MRRIKYYFLFILVVLTNNILSQNHFTPIWSSSPYQAMNIFLETATFSGTELSNGDEVAVYDGSVCVGSVKLSGVFTPYTEIKTSADDPLTPLVDGYISGHTISYKLWKSSSATEVTLVTITYNPTSPIPTFTTLGTIFVNLDFTAATQSILTVSPDYQAVASIAGSTTFNVSNTGSGTMNWTAVSNSNWVTVTSGSSGTNSGTINVSYTENTGVSRTGRITVTSSGATGSPKTVELRQESLIQSFVITTSSSPVAGGTTIGGNTYTNGSNVTVTATPNSGYVFANWTEGSTVVSNNASFTFTISSNRTLVANFTAILYTVGTSSNPAAGGTTSGGGTINSGTITTVMATANNGYTFSNWTENGTVVSSTASYTFTASTNRTLVANFVQTFVIITSSNPAVGGSTSGGGTKSSGANVTVTATANSGYYFNNWTENGIVVSSTASFTFTASLSRTLIANFSQIVSCIISASSNPVTGGSTSGGGTVNSGTSVTVIATANTGYTFINWTENGIVVSSTASYTFAASASRTLVANFVQTFLITTSSNPAAGGSTSGGGTKNSGASITLSATASNGYYFSNWTENGTVVSSNASYTFTATANRTLVANFSQIVSCTISTSSNPTSGGTTYGGGTVNSGTSVTVIATANTGYTFTNWTESGIVVSANASYLFTVAANRTLIANFSLINEIPGLNLNPVGPFSVGEGTALTITEVGTDADAGDVLTYSYSSTPNIIGAIFNISTGVFTWTPVSGQSGTYNITFSVTDGKATTTKSTTITVEKVNIAPTLTLSPNGPYSVVEGATISITLTGTDPNVGDVLSYLYSSTPLMTSAILSPTTNVFSWTPPVGAAGNYNVTFFVSDGTAITQLSRTLTVTPANRVPTLALYPTSPFTVAEGTTLNISAVGTEADAADVLVYSFTSTPTMTGATIHSSTGAFTWKPVTNQAGTYNVVFSVTDGKATTIQSATITVTKVNIAPTIILSPSTPYALLEGSSMAITVTGNDANNGDVLTYSYSSSPVMTGATFNPATHILYWQASAGSAGVYNVTFSVSDGTAITQQAITVTVSVLNNNPTLTLSPAGPYTVAEGSTLTFTAIGADNDASDVLAYSFTSNPTITGATFSSTTGAFSWKPLTNQAGVYNVTFSITDGKATTTKSTSITVAKVNIAPTLTLSPNGPYTLIEGAKLAITLTGADPNNGDVLNYSFTSTPAITGATINASTGAFNWTPSEGQAGLYNIIFTVSDGNVSTNYTSTITVTPLNSAPTLVLNPAGPFSVDEEVTLTFRAVGVDPNIGDVLTYSIVSVPEMIGSTFNTSTGVFSWKPVTNQAGTYNVDLKVSDGKLTTQVQTTVTVKKINLSPTLTLNPEGPYLVSEGQTLNITLLGTDPNIGDVLTYSITAPTTLPDGVKLTGNVFSWTPNFTQGITTPYNFTFTLKDEGGLSATVSIIIVVTNSNRAPVFTDVLPAGMVAKVNEPAPILFSYTYKATDPDGDKLYFSLIGSPTGSDITADGIFSWGPIRSQAGKSYTVTVMVSDGSLSAQTTQIISADPKVVAVKRENNIPAEYSLFQNYPNPFNPTAKIKFGLPERANTRLLIYDMLGRDVAWLVDEELDAGYHEISFDASKLSSGVYFYQIQAGEFISVKKMILMK